MVDAVKNHWPEYLMELGSLAIFMISACLFGALLQYPGSPARALFPHPLSRRVLMGIAMGATAIAIIYSPWGKQSGAHLNPSVTLTFYRLGKIHAWDAVFYTLFQFVGGVLGVTVAAALLGRIIRHPSVRYVATVPGRGGPATAFAAEFFISCGLFLVILLVSNNPRLSRFTGLFAGALVACYIAVEAPLSGMSMNPARTLGSAVPAHIWTALWIYFTAPPLGMLVAAETFIRQRGADQCRCAKLHHQNAKRCIFRCGYADGMHVGNNQA
jgi:aquaporin Z